MRSSRIALVLVMVAVGSLSYATFAPPSGPRSLRRFDPGRMADLELRMWQAYYAKENVRLFTLLVTTLREQYHYSWAVALTEAFHLARAAATFGNLRSNYTVVLPDLEAAYGQARSWLHAGFDPPTVARAELAWWVARRVPGQNTPEQVGSLMADEYALLYEASRDTMVRPALLRAEAAAMRDTEAARPDWATIGQLLHESYAELFRVLSSESA